MTTIDENRKMFQHPANFQKSFSKVSEVELPPELQAGLRGRVRQAEADSEAATETVRQQPEVPPSPREEVPEPRIVFGGGELPEPGAKAGKAG